MSGLHQLRLDFLSLPPSSIKHIKLILKINLNRHFALKLFSLSSGIAGDSLDPYLLWCWKWEGPVVNWGGRTTAAETAERPPPPTNPGMGPTAVLWVDIMQGLDIYADIYGDNRCWRQSAVTVTSVNSEQSEHQKLETVVPSHTWKQWRDDVICRGNRSQSSLELQTKVHSKVRNRREGPY